MTNILGCIIPGVTVAVAVTTASSESEFPRHVITNIHITAFYHQIFQNFTLHRTELNVELWAPLIVFVASYSYSPAQQDTSRTRSPEFSTCLDHSYLLAAFPLSFLGGGSGYWVQVTLAGSEPCFIPLLTPDTQWESRWRKSNASGKEWRHSIHQQNGILLVKVLRPYCQTRSVGTAGGPHDHLLPARRQRCHPITKGTQRSLPWRRQHTH